MGPAAGLLALDLQGAWRRGAAAQAVLPASAHIAHAPCRTPCLAHQFQQALQLRLVSCEADPTQQGGGLVKEQLGAVGLRLGARLHGCGRHAACECAAAPRKQLLDALWLCLASGGSCKCPGTQLCSGPYALWCVRGHR